MNRSTRCAALLAAWLAVPGLALAQIGPPPSPTATRSSTSVVPAPVTAPVPVRSDTPPSGHPAPMQGPLPSPVQPRQPIRSNGPAQLPATPSRALPDKVYDRDGRIVPGMKAVGPNRVLDTNTGRYYDSVPQGDGQRVK
ncbi:MAG: hypothetical protein GAK31_03189 [Stenotrophomonas maltophilia]|uniref:Classical arabinogalactan protein 4 n=1 Tax=Stenotrophomonas maltophilia TaxID=40324 RepID=A0A7V8FEY2_STEMA|nr:MAG: hypothetical protein GAK31_03189 [Stenotrophomonas maltophilia]